MKVILEFFKILRYHFFPFRFRIDQDFSHVIYTVYL